MNTEVKRGQRREIKVRKSVYENTDIRRRKVNDTRGKQKIKKSEREMKHSIKRGYEPE